MLKPYPTDSPPSTTPALLARMGPWVTYDEAAASLGCSRNTIARAMGKGVLRCFASRPRYVSTEDLAYLYQCRKEKRLPLHLGARGIAPGDTFSPVPLDGAAIYEQAVVSQNIELLLPAPTDLRTDAIAPPGAQLEMMNRRIDGLTELVGAMYSSTFAEISTAGPDDEEVYIALSRAVSDLSGPCSVPKAKKWVEFLTNVDSHWMRRIREWANEYPEEAQELCRVDVCPQAPLLRIADHVRRFARTADDGSFELTTLRRRAEAAWEHLSTLFYAALVESQIFHLQGTRMSPPGTSPTDQYILNQLRREEDSKTR